MDLMDKSSHIYLGSYLCEYSYMCLNYIFRLIRDSWRYVSASESVIEFGYSPIDLHVFIMIY